MEKVYFESAPGFFVTGIYLPSRCSPRRKAGRNNIPVSVRGAIRSDDELVA